jgi:hypothetical protein
MLLVELHDASPRQFLGHPLIHERIGAGDEEGRTIQTIIAEFREDRDPDALSFRLGDLAAPLLEDPVLNKSLAAEQMLQAISRPGPAPVLTSQFVVGGDAARWYEMRNPATLLKRRLEEAARTGRNPWHVRPSLASDTAAALNELRIMCDWMELQLEFRLKERELTELVLV